MKKYAVSLVFTKETPGNTNIKNYLQTIEAQSLEEAFGAVYSEAQEMEEFRDMCLGIRTFVEVK